MDTGELTAGRPSPRRCSASTTASITCGGRAAGEAPRDYFRAHAKRLRPKLEKLAKGSSATAVKAKAALSI